MSTACIGLGSNLGDRWFNLTSALDRLRAEPGLRLLRVSSFYETVPVDCPPGSDPFLNAAAMIACDRSPEQLLKLLQQIEKQFGRIRTEMHAPRTLDLDVLLFDDCVLSTPDLIVPHPRMSERAFVLIPLAEIASELVHPITKRSIQELMATLPLVERESVVKYPKPVSCAGSLRGLRTLVTGSSSGIGRAIAMAYAREGAQVIIHGRSEDRLEETRQDCNGLSLTGSEVAAITADLKETREIDRLANQAWAQWGAIDVLVCNAGADVLTGAESQGSFDDKLAALFAVDLKATMRLARDLGGRMKAQGRGNIITMGWDQAETGLEGDSGQLFAAIKGAVICFTRSLALSLAPDVRVNCIAPGWIRTAWGETATPVWQERVRKETPLGIWGLPVDVAASAVWLATPAARFITGQTIRVNGGSIRI
jgi:2-amino-4-hydroxy-6-hydroxymethyldihydropteridine diphosphokinase